jgi:AcrR family transcriptional regulator
VRTSSSSKAVGKVAHQAHQTHQPRRPRTKSQQQNAEKLLDAMVTETVEFGLDDLRSSRVADNAGLTTGSLYSRYENADEMLIALWQERIRTPFLQHLRDTVQYVQGTHPLQHAVIRSIEKPSPLLRLGAEFLVVAQRNDTIGEVVAPAITSTLDDLGLNERCDPLTGAIVMVAASAAVGTTFRSFISPTNPGWGATLTSLRAAASRATPLRFTAPLGDTAPEPINTGNPVRDELLMSAKRVVARVGFKNATVTRIARRAGFSTSAIYQLWPDKESMLDEAINAVLVLDYGQSSRAKFAALTDNRGDFGFADSWYFGMMPARRARLDFRLECIIASRYRLATRRELQKFTRSADSILQSMFPKIPHAITAQITATEQALGYGFVALTKYTPQPQRLDYFSLMSSLAKVARLA